VTMKFKIWGGFLLALASSHAQVASHTPTVFKPAPAQQRPAMGDTAQKPAASAFARIRVGERLSSLGRPSPRLGGRPLGPSAAAARALGRASLGAAWRRLGAGGRPLELGAFPLFQFLQSSRPIFAQQAAERAVGE